MAAYGAVATEPPGSLSAGVPSSVCIRVRACAHFCHFRVFSKGPATHTRRQHTGLTCGCTLAGSPVRTRRLVAMVAVCLCVSVALSSRMGSWPSSDARNAQGAQEPQMLWGGSSGASLQVPLAAAPTARQSQLADFEPAKLYTDPPATDFDHGNRIDNYGCMFSDCEGQKTPLLQTGLKPDMRHACSASACWRNVFHGQDDCHRSPCSKYHARSGGQTCDFRSCRRVFCACFACARLTNKACMQ